MLVERTLPPARDRLALIDNDAPVTQAAELMSKPHTDLVVVCGRDGEMVGVLTKTDIVGQIRQCTGCGCAAQVESIMTRDVVACRPEDHLKDVWATMMRHGLQRVPVVDGGRRPLGILYARDALQSLLGEVEHEEALLRDYVMCVGYR
ncbi:CBS domain-containing protein [Microvirga splendida]|uniref:CBS domain-containing protein n=1 Tax=Microvirga splendida TaxID=2795727 RepID=A0ABS0Y0J5_9HYPH|nr:CBS domain-containing protein [Microvirga splendida]MBJ6125550.1 CBS domain-containing protein [Microvirga splendida]